MACNLRKMPESFVTPPPLPFAFVITSSLYQNLSQTNTFVDFLNLVSDCNRQETKKEGHEGFWFEVFLSNRYYGHAIHYQDSDVNAIAVGHTC